MDEAEELNNIDDLIRNSIIVSRYEVNGTKTTGTMARNGYYVVPLFSANYAGVQNDFGVSGDVTIRRQAFELLAEYGYYNGMVPYISNQYKESAKSDQTILSDQYVLKNIFGGTYETMAEFKKAMFQRRIEKINELKPVTITWKNQSVTIDNFEKLRLLMKEAVESDLVNVNALPEGNNNIRAQATEVERLKQEIFKAYLFQTQDFRESIYGAGPTPSPAPTVAPTATPTPSLVPTVAPTAAPTLAPTPTPERTAAPEDKVSKLLLCKVSSGKNSQTIRWNSVKSADGYEIYGAKYNGKYKRLQTLRKKAGKWRHKRLKKGRQYKYYVTAYKNIGGKRAILSKSLPVYSRTKGGKYGNPLKVWVKRSLVSVKSGKKIRLRVKVKGKKIKKAEKKVRYVSSNSFVAKVSKKGVITGKKCGNCTVYCIAQNGLSKKVKVKVG